MVSDDLCSQPHLVESERLAVHLSLTEEAVKKSQPSFTSFILNLYDLWIDSVFFALS